MASFTTAFVNLKESENYGCVQSEVIKYLNDPIQDISAQTTTDVIKVSGSIGNSILVNPKQVDMKDPHYALKHLTSVCLLANLTLMLAWNAEEAGLILETYKIFQNKPPDLIMEHKESDPHLKLVNALSSIKSVNKTDATTLLSTFGSLGKIIKTSEENLVSCPGLGPNKATRLFKTLHQPFLKSGCLVNNKNLKNM
uniref:ERCC1-like central domain-containing protein n=1 Tax=Clastoptera arizonana TaxID=38151 RepID=A0A1B6EDB3_9HEMI